MGVFWRTGLAIFLFDQLSKVMIVEWLDLKSRGEIDVWPPFLVFRMAWNRGINFGLLADDGNLTRWLLIGVALAISAWVTWWVRNEGAPYLTAFFGGILVGGAIGNVLDRLVYGAVADFLNMSCCGFENPYVFNVADIAIFIGAFGLVVFGGKSTPQKNTP